MYSLPVLVALGEPALAQEVSVREGPLEGGGKLMPPADAAIVPWVAPEDTWRRLVAGGHAAPEPIGLRVCGQHSECLSADMPLPSCSESGCTHAWPFKDVQPRIPEIFDNLARYVPLHTHGPTAWGVWFHAERMIAYAKQIAVACDSSHAHCDAFDIIARHAQFHHLVEAAITAFELAPPRPLARYVPEDVAARGGDQEPLEELLANAWTFRTAIGCVERSTLQLLMQRVRMCGAPGYAAFDDAMESGPFAMAQTEQMCRRVAPDHDFVLPSEHGRAAEIPVYLWGSTAARAAVRPAARNALLGPLIGRARYAGQPAGSVSSEARAALFERFAILKTLGELDGVYAMIFEELDFDTIAGVRSGLIEWARAAPTMGELEPIALEIDAFERATRWATIEEALCVSPAG